MLDLSTPEIKFAMDAVRKASKLASQVQSEMTASELTKGDHSPVTVADFAVQSLVGKMMSDQLPGELLVAEESAEVLRMGEADAILDQVIEFVERFIPGASAEDICDWIDYGNGEPSNRFWTLDPIDGTKGFIRGEQYAVALALIKNGKVQLALLGCPNLNTECKPDVGGYGSMVVAVRGQGTWITSLCDEGELDFKRLQVSDQTDPSKACVLRSVEAGHTNAGRTVAFFENLKIKKEPVYMDSQAKHAALAAGVGDVFFYLLPIDNPDFRMKIWDVAPGALVIEEAGGRISDLEGKDIDFNAGLTVAHNPGLLMSNGKLHGVILKTLQSIKSN